MLQHILIAFFASLFAVMWIHPLVVRIAIEKNIVDNPDARKLQRIPIPVLGGCAVLFGILLGIGFTSAHCGCPSLFIIITAMTIMLYTGTMDDILSLSPRLRFIIEIMVVALLIMANKQSIDNFFGLWGLSTIPQWISFPLTIFAAVGIINAINLIDGVDGLSSGYGVMASIAFAALFSLAGDVSMLTLAVVTAGSLIPFFFHNVFGKTSKMFIGDGGTLVLGVVFSSFVINTLADGSVVGKFTENGFGLIPFTLAVLSIPVFDTLRVMLARIARRTSPFSPDKTHLHHLFIELGFSHAGTTVSILTLNSLIILLHLLSWRLGCSVDVQLYIVIGASLLSTTGFYYSTKAMSDNNLFKRMVKAIGRASRIERKGFFLTMQKLMDKI